MKNIILICGEATSGKSTLAECISHLLDNSVGSFNPVTLIRNNGQDVKNEAVKLHNWNQVKDEKGRQLLIDITNEGYAKNKYYWEESNYTEATIYKEFINKRCHTLIVPDWRYAQSEEYYKKVADNLIRVRVTRDKLTGTHSSHNSENDFKNFEVDFVVSNNSTLDNLEREAKKIVSRCSY